jgi:hypothetical protein
MSESPTRDLPTTSALVRLRLLTEDARRRATDASEAGRHMALIALDGACEHALWLASRAHGVSVKERAGLPELYSALKPALTGWQVRGWPGVSQMHQARNVAQHAGVAQDVAQLLSWADATVAFIDSLCQAAFGIGLKDIVLADAVQDPVLRDQLRWSELQLEDNPAHSFSVTVEAFDAARGRWRNQRSWPVLAPSRPGDPTAPQVSAPVQELDDLAEIQPFAGDLGEYTWLQRARQEASWTGWQPNAHDARRALLFVAGWIVRWEIFDRGYPADRWEAHRESIQPPVTGDGNRTQIIGAQVEFVPDAPGQPGRNAIYLALANVPGRGRSPWDMVLRDALVECARDAGNGALFLDVTWWVSGTLAVQVALDADSRLVADVAERAVALAAERARSQRAASEQRERRRTTVEASLREVMTSACSDGLHLFGQALVVEDEGLGTAGWLALLPIRTETPAQLELTQTNGIFHNQLAAFPNLHVRERQIAFSIDEMTPELADALRTAISSSEDQARHVRAVRERQNQTFHAFAADLHERFGSLPD